MQGKKLGYKKSPMIVRYDSLTKILNKLFVQNNIQQNKKFKKMKVSI